MAKKARQRSKGTGTLVLRGKTWCARWTVNGKVFTRTTGTSDQRKAEEKLTEFVAPFRLGGEKKTLETVAARLGGVEAEIQRYEDEKPATTIRHGWQAYIDQHNRPDTGESTLAVYEGQFETFAKWFKDNYSEQLDRDDKPIAWELRHVTQNHADAYAGHLLKIVGASTFNRHMNLLALVWRVLAKSARITANPWTEENIKRKKFTAHSRRELTIEELGAVFNAAQGEMRVLLALGTFCGLRLGDAACLDWGSVDMVKRIISLIPRKTARRKNKRVTLPIHPALYDMLEEIPKGRRRGFVLPVMAERYDAFDGALAKDVARLFLDCDIKTGANKLTKTERETLEKAKAEALAAGVELPTVTHTAKRASADVGYHSLRHTFVSLCAAGGVSQSVVQSLVGHGSPAMTQHYTHIGIETAQRAVAMLPDVTSMNTLPEHTDATGASVEAVLSMLGTLTADQLKVVVKQARKQIGKLEKVEVAK